MAQPSIVTKSSLTPDPTRGSPALPTPTAGVKRKRVTEQKFYGVKEGKKPGIYHTWEECLDQVKGHKGALFKAFPSLHEAQAFVEGKQLAQVSSRQSGEQKFYAVQNGKKPGVYTDWPSAQAQISQFKNPRHKKFNTRAEADAFVAAGQKPSSFESYADMTSEEQIRRIIVQSSAPGLITNSSYAPRDKDGNEFEPGRGPLPLGAEDGFDPNLKFTAEGAIAFKTEAEKAKTKMILREKDTPGMLRIYTDGSSLKNGQAGARAGVGVFFGPQDPMYANQTPHPLYTIDWVARGAPPVPRRRRLTWRYRNVSEALRGTKQTNQRAELTAILRALDIAPKHRDVTIYTDSKYAISCVTEWYKNWVRNDWKNSKGKPVENKDLIVDVRSKIEERDMLKRGTFFVWVKGHAGDEGNVAADRLAVAGARLGRGVTADVEAMEAMERAEEAEESVGDIDMVSGEEDQEVIDAYRLMDQAMEDDDEDEDDI